MPASPVPVPVFTSGPNLSSANNQSIVVVGGDAVNPLRQIGQLVQQLNFASPANGGVNWRAPDGSVYGLSGDSPMPQADFPGKKTEIPLGLILVGVALLAWKLLK